MNEKPKVCGACGRAFGVGRWDVHRSRNDDTRCVDCIWSDINNENMRSAELLKIERLVSRVSDMNRRQILTLLEAMSTISHPEASDHSAAKPAADTSGQRSGKNSQ